MKEIPILFSTAMVQAILQGRKTQTRRIVKTKFFPASEIASIHKDGSGKGWIAWSPLPVSSEKTKELYPGEDGFKCPYGIEGDILWVRECWRPDIAGAECDSYCEYIKYGADGGRLAIKWVKDYDDFRYRPGIHMNKEYARIWLQVTDVRVERLQDITEEDTIAEGVEPRSHRCGGFGSYEAGGYIHDCICQKWDRTPAGMGFMDLWKDINGPESWEANPFCWVISFKVLSTTGKPDLQTLKAIA